MLNPGGDSMTSPANSKTHRRFDPSLYLVINPEQCANGSVVQTARRAAQGGVTAIQLRSKTLDKAQLTAMVVEVSKALESHDVAIFVNDRVDVALASGVNAVHLGQDDADAVSARRTMGDDALLGLTARSVAEADDAPLGQLDYISVGGIFPTSSKLNPDPPIGLDGLKTIVNRLRERDCELPIIAISGITQQNLQSVLQCGVDGVAVVSAICEACDPEAAAQEFRTMIDTHIHPERQS